MPEDFPDRGLVGLESLGWVYQVLRLALPLTWGISLMRETLTGGGSLSSLFQSEEFVMLTLHSVLYLLVGFAVFSLGYMRAKAKGTLAHY